MRTTTAGATAGPGVVDVGADCYDINADLEPGDACSHGARHDGDIAHRRRHRPAPCVATSYRACRATTPSFDASPDDGNLWRAIRQQLLVVTIAPATRDELAVHGRAVCVLAFYAAGSDGVETPPTSSSPSTLDRLVTDAEAAHGRRRVLRPAKLRHGLRLRTGACFTDARRSYLSRRTPPPRTRGGRHIPEASDRGRLEFDPVAESTATSDSVSYPDVATPPNTPADAVREHQRPDLGRPATRARGFVIPPAMPDSLPTTTILAGDPRGILLRGIIPHYVLTSSLGTILQHGPSAIFKAMKVPTSGASHRPGHAEAVLAVATQAPAASRRSTTRDRTRPSEHRPSRRWSAGRHGTKPVITAREVADAMEELEKRHEFMDHREADMAVQARTADRVPVVERAAQEYRVEIRAAKRQNPSPSRPLTSPTSTA